MLTCIASTCLALSPGAVPLQDAVDFFRESVAPILEAHCLECHGSGERLRGGLWLTNRQGLLDGGETGPAIDLESPELSLLLAKISYRDEQHRMPPNGQLADREREILERWITGGAQWHADVSFPEHAKIEPERLTKGDGLTGWAYQPVQDPVVPKVQQASWPKNGVDSFLLAKMEAAGLTPTPEIDRPAWLRRVNYGLTGLPPTPAETRAFVDDLAPDAHERVIDRLLASPHYGERWGRHWLDLVRYAETNGFERDSDKPEVWRYRDWVVRAFNEDLPYDQFLTMQLAGDELDTVSHDSLIATGYLRLMQWDDEPPEGRVQARYDVLDDIVRTTSETMLATTIGCARCHDHKGDAIDQTDYYSFMSFFEGLTNYRTEGWLVPILTEEQELEHAHAKAQHAVEQAATEKDLLALEEEFRQAFAAQGVGSKRTLLEHIEYRFYRHPFRSLDDFEDLRHEDEGRLAGGVFDLSPATRGEDFGFIFEGVLRVPFGGAWDIVLDSDDGARITIDGKVAVEKDHLGPLGDPNKARVELAAGPQPVMLEYFQWVGGAEVQLTLTPAGANLWRTQETAPSQGWEQPDYDDSTWSASQAGFGRAGTPGTEIGTTWESDELWMRQSFQWSVEESTDPVLVAHHDDDLRVWINGVLAAEASEYLVDYKVIELNEAGRAALVDGENLLAMHVINREYGQYAHGRIVDRAEALGGALTDVAFARYRLAGDAPGNIGTLDRRIATSGAEVLGAEAAERHKALEKRVEHLQRHPPRPPALANIATETGPKPPLMRVHVRGSARAMGDEVPIAFPACLNPPPAIIPEPAPDSQTSGRRRVLAEWITSPDNPLTARVMVNRVWQHHFGAGLVPTPGDFGELGERPSHPELLDWLALRFVEDGWSVKDLHRLLLTSAAYRMDSRGPAPDPRADPTGALLSRFRPRRLSAEEVRDSILWLTGHLNPQVGGRSFYSMMPAQALATSSRPNSTWGTSPIEDLRRRSLYIKVKRSLLTPLLSAFDLADTDSSCPVRHVTTSPSQALGLLNGEFSQTRAAEFAARVRLAHPGDPKSQVNTALELALGRAPLEADLADALDLLAALQLEHGMDPDQALDQVCLYIQNLSEFVYLD